MNKHNLDAINELFGMPTPVGGISRDFYWAVRGNWPAIAAILTAHFEQESASVTLDHSEVIFTFPNDEVARRFYDSVSPPQEER